MELNRPVQATGIAEPRGGTPEGAGRTGFLADPVEWLTGLAVALLGTAMATAGAMALAHLLPEASLTLVYLLAIVMVAAGLGVAAGIATSVLASLAYNFFFIPPIYTLSIAEPRQLFAFFVFVIVAILTGSLAGRMRQLAQEAGERASTLQSLNAFAARLTATRETGAILSATARYAAESTQGGAVVVVQDGRDAHDEQALRISERWPPETDIDTADWQTAYRAFRSQRFVAGTASGWTGGRYGFYPIPGLRCVLGVRDGSGAETASQLSDQHQSIEAAIGHAVIALERVQAEDEARRARSEMERERLRSSVLASLSHDLRTPLASILGAVTSLRELGQDMTPATRE
ncbi:MAG: DUF4118 domain-containing protein, partial [Proteobacteria bacterium]|nr:DUF4118 domain-containing protein [Pseudomonadota bacterium]